jgi:hypothetical protein
MCQNLHRRLILHEKVTIVIGLKEVLPDTTISPIVYLSILFCDRDKFENKSTRVSNINLML